MYMKYVVTGAAGNVAKPLTLQLLAAGHAVTVIGRNEKNLEPLLRAGAQAAIGSVEDLSFLKEVFAGANAIFTMVPTDIFTPDLQAQHELIGSNYAEAIATNDITHVVNLSAIGAHLTEGAGPLSAKHYTEQALYSLKNVHIRTLRGVYFYQNLLTMIDMIRYMKIMGSNFSFASGKFPLVHTDDVAAEAAEELSKLDFSGHSIRYVASDETGTDEIAAVIGSAIGKQLLQWTKFSGEQVYQNLQQAGLPEKTAREYTDMFDAMDNGQVTEDYWKNRPQRFGKIKLPDFANQFAEIFHSQEKLITQ
jgi:uncharacterized protein YbjT (DUF2867 family)